MKISRMIQRYLTGLLAAGMLLCLIPAALVRADANLGISISGNNEVGSTITVSFIASGAGPYSGFNGALSYDSSILELTGISQGNYAKANFSSSGLNFVEYQANIPGGAVLVSSTFKCLTAGSTTISCSLEALGDMNGQDISASASKEVNITTPIPKSANADLSSLAIAPGTLSPAFAAGTQNYTATVAANQSKITVSASPADAKSKVSLNGVQDKLVAGSNTVKVTVTAENGGTKVYTITVTRSTGPTPTPSPTPVPLPPMQYNGADYTILAAGTADGIPEGFTAATAKYKGVDIPVLQKTLGEAVDASVMTIILLTADARTGYFVYDAATETCYPYQLISSTVMSFQIMDKSAAASVPAGYEAFDYTYLDSTVTAFRLISDPANPQVLLYLMDGSGIAAFYYYDTQNMMLLLYRGEVIIAAVTPTSTPSPTAAPSETGVAIPTAAVGLLSAPAAAGLSFHSLLDYRNPVVLLIYLIALFCLILLIVCIVLIAKRGKVYEMEEYEEDTGEYQESDDSTASVPVIAPKPSAYFQELAQPQEENKLYFGDEPPVDEYKHDYPVMPHRVIAPNNSVNTTGGRLTNNSDINGLNSATKATNIPVKSNAQAVDGVQPGQLAEHVPVRLQKALDAEQAQSSGTIRDADSSVSAKPVNDPDFDPDDE